MYCCMSSRANGDLLPSGVVPLIPMAKRTHRRVRFPGDHETIFEENTQLEKGKLKYRWWILE